ncbi:DUF4972 domain-containing protein [Olivibacter ginsenosidimutans]
MQRIIYLTKRRYPMAPVLVCLLLFFGACSKKDSPTIKIYEYREQIGKKMKEIDDLKSNAVFGVKKGMYPEESRSLLEAAYADLRDLLQQIKEQTITNEQVMSETNHHLQHADEQMEAFKASVRLENLATPAELEINGKNGGYIDFGAHTEYASFGALGHQTFTVEFWVKLKDVEGFFFLVSTFIDDETNDHERKGWAVNSYNYGGNHLRMTYGMGFNDLMEPAIPFNTVNEWVHIAIVTNEDGVDDESVDGRPVMTKIYLNGELRLKTISHQSAEKPYNANDRAIPMVAFAGLDIAGNRISDKGGNGSIKHFHLWKSAKTANQLRSIMNQPSQIVGTESDLICGWPFDNIVEDDSQILDLTGKYTAKLIGDYRWLELN